MNACPQRPPRFSQPDAPVLELVRAYIERALAYRRRYRYVKPPVAREGLGWKVLSPNCSRLCVDPAREFWR